ncbi:MAG: hypothetical protein K6E68_10290 [Lachnospiraceae bacterium]|nr:hypothetical protein [Lachnospiraceae bacterium]
MTEIVEIYKAYNGTGYYCLMFIAALLYLWFTEEDKHLRLLLVIVPTVIQALFFIPYFYMAYNMLDEGTYYRILWLLPMTLVIAYSATRAIGTHTRVGVAAVAVILAISGTYSYVGATFSVAENAYHLPDELIELCDMVRPEEGKERIWAAFPPKLVHYVRQYTSEIMMPFGRDSMVDTWKRLDNPLYDEYMRPVMRADELAIQATEYNCHYCIIDKEKELEGDLSGEGFELFGETEHFLVYRNKSVPFAEDI